MSGAREGAVGAAERRRCMFSPGGRDADMGLAGGLSRRVRAHRARRRRRPLADRASRTSAASSRPTAPIRAVVAPQPGAGDRLVRALAAGEPLEAQGGHRLAGRGKFGDPADDVEVDRAQDADAHRSPNRPWRRRYGFAVGAVNAARLTGGPPARALWSDPWTIVALNGTRSCPDLADQSISARRRRPRSVENLVLRLMELLAASARPRGVAEIAREQGISKTRAHRHLRALVRHRHARQELDTERLRGGRQADAAGRGGARSLRCADSHAPGNGRCSGRRTGQAVTASALRRGVRWSCWSSCTAGP